MRLIIQKDRSANIRDLSLWNPVHVLYNLWSHRELIWSLVRREVRQRYRGTFLGLLWAWIIPILMMVIYTFVFSYVFKAKWQGTETQPADFALILFAGLIAFNVFSEIANTSPTLILGVPNYVRKVVFPLEVLPVVRLGSALVNSLISVILLVLLNLFLTRSLSRTLIFLPLAYLPLIFLCLASGWFLSSLGVYIRDTAEVMKVVMRILFFLSPVFYSVEAVPGFLQGVLKVNPLTIILTAFRQSLIWDEPLSWIIWGAWTVFNALLAYSGYIWFMKTKKGFADVI